MEEFEAQSYPGSSRGLRKSTELRDLEQKYNTLGRLGWYQEACSLKGRVQSLTARDGARSAREAARQQNARKKLMIERHGKEIRGAVTKIEKDRLQRQLHRESEEKTLAERSANAKRCLRRRQDTELKRADSGARRYLCHRAGLIVSLLPYMTRHDDSSSVKQLFKDLVPSPTLLLTYPMFMANARLLVYKDPQLLALRKAEKIRMPLVLHKMKDIKYVYGVGALFRGVDVLRESGALMGLSSLRCSRCAKVILKYPVTGLEVSPRKKTAYRYAVEFVTYPLLLATARIAVYGQDPILDCGLQQCFKETVKYDGVGGLWSGVIPYMISLSYEEFTQWVMSLLRSRHPKLDKTDELVLRACLVGHGAVLTTPFLSMSTILRCQSENPNLPDPQPLMDVVSNLPWKSTMIQLTLISALCALNYALIEDKHAEDDDDDQDHRRQ
ncbi:hypothetical protein FOZ62_027403 [Perkinsus olseni]|uniref:Uncharacterized protein n=1 Tax=Perkinsus olseni TaxID=32597 RepID=A0A7J6PS76_PEROL|nr:hypothetical protein FOZ62_027403 [Perkinsus olseni]